MRHWTTLSGAHHTAHAPGWAQVAVGAPSLHGLRYGEVLQATLLAYTSLKIFPDVVADTACHSALESKVKRRISE
jgi:hypothetical protein